MKHASMLAAILVCGLSSALSAATPPEGVATLYGDLSVTSSIWSSSDVWSTTRDGPKVAWTDGSYGIVTSIRSDGGDTFAMYGLQFWGLRFEQPRGNVRSHWDSAHSNSGTPLWTIGAGGLELASNVNVSVGSTECRNRIKLTASQTWKGPDSTPKVHFAVGHDDYGNYYKAGATSTVDCATLTITGNLSTWFTWTNYFGNTEIRVEKPARVYLEKGWKYNQVDYTGAPQLNAKKLTLSGDGTMWNAGGTSPVANARKTPQLEPEMDTVTVAQTLALEDGADVVGSSAGWNIPSLEVSGTGTSSFTGTWTFRRARTAVSIASGSALELTGTMSEAEGVSAGFDVTGAGRLKIVKSTYNLTGAISLDGSTLEVEGMLDVPVTGTGRVVVSGATTGVTPIRGNLLSGFTGTLEVQAGNVYLDSIPSGVTVETSGSGVIYSDEMLPTYYGRWGFEKETERWTDASGQIATPTAYANVCITNFTTNTYGRARQFSGKYVFHGIEMSTTRMNGNWLSKVDFSVGSGGISFTTACDLGIGTTGGSKQLKLIADQEWKGPSSGSTYATLQVGFPGYSAYGYHNSKLGVAVGVESLKISGMLMAYFATTNELKSLDVEVEAPAKLVLCNSWKNDNKSIIGDAHLGARSLTLSGDGSGLLLGATDVYYPYNSAANISTITTLDAAYVADTLTLKNGADLTASSAVRFDLPGLSVVGPGTSVITGKFEIARSSLSVALSGGATLDLAGTIVETQPGTTLSVTGSGTVIIRSGYGLTGGISLGPDVALKVLGRAEFLLPVTGGKSIEFAAAGGGTLFVPAAVVAGFTGDTITVTSGTVVFETAPTGVEIVEDGGIAKYASDSTDGTWLVTDVPRSEQKIVVGEGETLTVCGSGLTAGTELELAGGRVEFVRTTTIASPVKCTATSSIGSVEEVVGTVAGHIVASNDTDTALNLSGKGTVNLSGGCAFSKTALYVTKGLANLTAGHFVVFDARCGLIDNGEYLGIRDSATLEMPQPTKSAQLLICDSTVSGRDSVIDVATGGVVRLTGNTVWIGRDNYNNGTAPTLRISGGSLSIVKGYEFIVSENSRKTARLELIDGELVTDHCIKRAGVADIAWYGGTIKLGDKYGTSSFNECKTMLTSSTNGISFRLLGPTCRLDLNGMAAFTNVLVGASNEGSWTAAEGACLTVANGGECVLNRFAEGGLVGVDGCSVLVSDPAAPQLGGVVFRGSGADTVSVPLEAAQEVDVIVASGARWGLGQLGNLTVGDVLFEDGAGLRLGVSANGVIEPVNVAGSVTCGGVLGIEFVRSGAMPKSGAQTLLSAAGGLTGPSSFVGLSPATRGATFAAVVNDIVANIARPGFRILFH